MTESYDLMIRGGVCATPNGIAPADIGVKGGKIASVGALGAAQAAEIFDAKGLHVLPGVIDTQVHFREPGNEEKETVATGSRAAAAGGYTAVVTMPDTDPAVDNSGMVRYMIDRGREAGLCRIFPTGAISPGRRGEGGPVEPDAVEQAQGADDVGLDERFG